MRRFAFSYYVGLFILVFFLYANFLHATVLNFKLFMVGVVSGAGAIILILIGIYVAARTNGST